MWGLTASMMAESGSVSPGNCQRWLPTWLPWISLAPLMFEYTKTAFIAQRPTTAVSANSPRDHPTGPSGQWDDESTSMRTRFLMSAEVSGCVWMPVEANESNALMAPCGLMSVDNRSHLAPTSERVLVVDLPDGVSQPRRVAATTGVTLSDEGSRRERARSRRYLKSALGCLPCSFTDLLSCVVDALS